MKKIGEEGEGIEILETQNIQVIGDIKIRSDKGVIKIKFNELFYLDEGYMVTKK